MASDPLKALSQMMGGFKTGQANPLATTAASAAGASKRQEKPKEGATRTRQRKQGEEAGRDPKHGRSSDLPPPSPSGQKGGNTPPPEGKAADSGTAGQQTEGFSKELPIGEVNIFDEALDINNADLDWAFLGKKTLEHINHNNLDDMVREVIHNHFKSVLIMKYLDQHYIPSLQKKADIGEKNKQQLRKLRDKQTELEKELKEAKDAVAAALEEKKLAEDKAKSADELLVSVKGQIKELQTEVDGLKDSINKARDLAEDEVRKTEERLTQQWEVEKGALVQTFAGLAHAVEKTILQQVRIRNPQVGLDFRGISAMHIVEDDRIFSRGANGEKADEVIIHTETKNEDVELRQVDVGDNASEKYGGAGSPTSTQVS